MRWNAETCDGVCVVSVKAMLEDNRVACAKMLHVPDGAARRLIAAAVVLALVYYCVGPTRAEPGANPGCGES